MRLSVVRNGIVDLLRCGEAPLTREEILSGLRTKKKIFCGTKTRLALGKIGKLLEGLIETGVVSNGEGKTVIRKNGGCEYEVSCYRLTQQELGLQAVPPAKPAPMPPKPVTFRAVYDAIVELGGEASSIRVEALLANKNPEYKLEYVKHNHSVSTSLSGLKVGGILEDTGAKEKVRGRKGKPSSIYRVAREWPPRVSFASMVQEIKARPTPTPTADSPKLSLEDLVAAIEEGAKNKRRVAELEREVANLMFYKEVYHTLRDQIKAVEKKYRGIIEGGKSK